MLWQTMMPLQSIIRDIWLAGLGVQALLIAVLLARKIWQKFPSFTTYVAFNLIGQVVTYIVFDKGIAHFYAFWVCETVVIVLTLRAVWEIFTNLFSPHPALQKLARIIFRITVVGLVLLAVGVIYMQSGDAKGIADAISLAAEAARIVEVGLIMFLLLSSSAFGLHWRQSTFGIILGLGMYAAVELTIMALVNYLGPASISGLSLARGIAFNFSLFIWLGYLLAPERVTSNVEVPKRAQLEQWNQAVMELISR
jgi:hypothetical protein